MIPFGPDSGGETKGVELEDDDDKELLAGSTLRLL